MLNDNDHKDLYECVSEEMGGECECKGDFLKCSQEPGGCCSVEEIGDMAPYCKGATMTRLKATLDRYQAMQPIIEQMLELLEVDHMKCDLASAEECELMGMGDSEWQIEYNHGLLREARQILEKAEEKTNHEV